MSQDWQGALCQFLGLKPHLLERPLIGEDVGMIDAKEMSFFDD
jgi:hypothetical protein